MDSSGDVFAAYPYSPPNCVGVPGRPGPCIGGRPTGLAAEDLRLAARAIGRVTGHIDIDDLLDVIFSDFCIGK